MQVRRWITAFAICAAASTGIARAAVTEDSFSVRNAGDLVDLCSAQTTDPLYTASVNFCQGFVSGVFRVLREEDMARRSRALFCIPQPAPTRNEAIAGFVQWAKGKPDQMTRSPADAVAMFLSQQYPCPSGAGSRGTHR
jgi:hypothetical protein